MVGQALSFALVLLTCTAILGSHTPSVTIGAGIIYGGRCSGGVNARFFKSIPYAKSPVGTSRFQLAQPYTGQYPGGTLNGTIAAPACIQFGMLFPEPPPVSENCLFLNIWTPSNATNSSSLPVKAWIYGGGNNAGGISDALYDGCSVAAAGSIFVSINYRVGPLGFLALESAGIPGNQGISDILAGLQWVQGNIAAFGGDPDKVLLHGQSAGATDVFTVATLPQAPTLMRAAAMESGGGRDIPLNDTAQALGVDFAKGLNCSSTYRQCLTSVSVADILSTFNNLPILNSDTFPLLQSSTILSSAFQPHVDGKLIPNEPSQVGVQVPSIFGSASMDGALFALLQFANTTKGLDSATLSDYETFLVQNFGPNIATLIEQAYPVSAFNSTPFPAFYAMSAVVGDLNYLCTAYRGLNLSSTQGNVRVWTYNFAYTPHCPWIPGLPQEALQIVGPTHTVEIPFVFGHTTPIANCSMTSDERSLSDFLMNAWTNMAINGEPTTTGQASYNSLNKNKLYKDSCFDLNKKQLYKDSCFFWPEYTNSQRSLGINIGGKTNTSSALPIPGHVDYTACVFWDQVNQLLDAEANNTSLGSNSTGPITTGPKPISGAQTRLSVNMALLSITYLLATTLLF
ncbi:putative carboxylesterase [Xylogone sp. PMI_703]|nr:putative carboxylesterase [Xylogone sp. PMI_703]